MDESFVCRVCLSVNDLEMIFKKENEDLLSKLRLVGGVSIAKDDHLPQCICQVCSCELQFAFDLLSQYEATCNKLRIASRYQTNVEEKPPTANFHEKKQEARAEQIQKEVQAAEADNILVAEIVVKEEMFSNDEDGIAGLESKKMFGSSNDIYVYKIEAVDDSNNKNREKMFELNLYDGNCSSGLHERNQYSDADLPTESDYIDIVVKEETKLAEEIEIVVNFEQYRSSHTGKPECKRERCEEISLKDTKRDDKGNVNDEKNKRISNKRFHNDVQTQKNLLCDPTTGSKTSECLKNKKCLKNSQHEATMKYHQTKGKQSPKSSVRLSRLQSQQTMKDNVLQANAIGLNKNPILLKYGELDEKLSGQYLLKQQDDLHANYELKTCDKWYKSLEKGRLLRKRLSSEAFKCDFCDKKFSCMKYLKQHQTRHLEHKLLACDECGKSFITERSMNEHQMLHLNPDAFKCQHCEKRFSSKTSLGKHVIVHSNPGLLTCDKCGKSYATEHLMNEHLMLHLNPDAFKCEHCDKRFLHKQYLKSHQMIHQKPDCFKCEQCGKMFSSKHILGKHIIIHSNPELLACDKCGKSFATERSMNEHQLLHLNPDTFKCEFCDKRFSSKSTLANHKITHSNPELLTCDKCRKTFPYASRLRDHKKWHLNPDAFK